MQPRIRKRLTRRAKSIIGLLMAALIWKKRASGKSYPYAVYRDAQGKQHWISLVKYAGRPLNRREAKSYFGDWLRYGARHTATIPTKLTTYCEEYRQYCKVQKSPTTAKTDVRRVNELESWLSDHGVRRIDQITLKMIDDFKAYKQSQGTGHVTINRLLELLRAMMNRAVDLGYLNHSPIARLKMLPKRGQRHVRALSDDEKRLVDTFPSPEREWCLLGIYAGLRRSEIVYLEWIDIDFRSGIVKVQGKPEFSPKSLRPRAVPLAKPLCQALRGMKRKGRFVFDKGNDTPLYVVENSWYKRIIPLMKDAGITDANLHSLRHTFATSLMRQGVAPQVVQELCGHRSYQTTEKYTHVDRKDLKTAVDLLR